MHYNHLSGRNDTRFSYYYKPEKNKKEIAQRLNRLPSTISREIKRNSKPNQAYQAHEAVILARKVSIGDIS